MSCDVVEATEGLENELWSYVMNSGGWITCGVRCGGKICRKAIGGSPGDVSEEPVT